MFRTFRRMVPQLIQISNSTSHNLVRKCSTVTRNNTPRVQGLAPNFKGIAVINDAFKEISLDSFDKKYVVLVFYPLDFTFVCPTELIAFNEKYQKFQELNTEVIGISIDSHFTHLGWMNTKRSAGGLGKLKFPLLSDINKIIAKSYNVLLENEGIALRGLFIIDPKRIIRHMSINDLPIGRSVDESLRLIEAIQFFESHGEVCPANWKKGSKTIKPDPKGSKEYFQATNE
ncbi:hypothetical protein RN001_012261 [Aquatica leii]|uniref:thioredoxin-dependent peroxiredoxin n=1 Tax=Aquatica leii TaxID=1421715 RepID=A0AAN7PSP7_9COLE|nr:hypothetical protein RN001_012261 [Aquatica leii]